ncbi:MAG: DUF1223 domain-containing protein [Pseudomonadota bacterium]
MKIAHSLLLAASMMLPVASHSVEFNSGEQQVGLLELYTSEGCSSCPPADRWLSTLLEEDGLWRDIVPVAFHVDYWDYIGWKDRFADPSHTTRQRLHAREQGMRTIYTPGFMYNGKEWRQWFVRRYFDFPDAQPSGELKVRVDKGQAMISFEPTANLQDDIEVNISVLGFGVTTQVHAGENEGETLSHDFVVLGTRKGELDKVADQFSGEISLPDVSQTAPRYGVAVWVNAVGSQQPLQATGGWLN